MNFLLVDIYVKRVAHHFVTLINQRFFSPVPVATIRYFYQGIRTGFNP